MTNKTFISGRGQKTLFIMLGVGVIGFVVGLYMNDARLWPSFLLNAFFFLTLALGAVVFVSINHVANAGWPTAIRRVPEAMMNYLPLGSLAMLVLFFGRYTLYEGTHVTFEYAGKPMAFIRAQPLVYKIFKVSALDAMFPFFDDEAQAIQTLWQ